MGASSGQDPELLRRLLRAKDRMDAASHEAWPVRRLAQVSGVSEAHFARAFKTAFGVPPHRYLLTRRLERAAALLRNTDRPVTEICLAVGLSGLGSFTTTFGRVYGLSPLAYRASFPPPQRHIRVPLCVAQAYGRPENRTFREVASTSRP